MKRRFALPVALCVALATAAILPPAASAGPPPRVKGLICSKSLKASAAKNAIWWTNFQGARKGFFDQRETTMMVRCFRSQADCKAWLYWAQTDWPDWNQWLPCKRGFPY